MKLFFSIIIPLYNKEKHIKNTLKSVMTQTFPDFEIIIVNDGSTDSSEKEVSSLNDERIKLFKIENHGVSYARNYGVSKASSDFIVLLDADDLWKPNHLENLKTLREKFPNCGMYAAAYESQYNKKVIPSIFYNVPTEANWSGIIEDFFESSSINCIAYSSSVMIPKTIYETIGGFNTTYNSGEDIDLWIRIALKHNVAFTNTVSVTIHMTAENKASQTSINTRSHLNFDTFKEEKRNQSLKRYLDLNRYSLAIQHKLAGNTFEARRLIHNIDNRNLNNKQRILLQMNTPILKLMVQIKNLLRKNGIGLSAFR